MARASAAHSPICRRDGSVEGANGAFQSFKEGANVSHDGDARTDATPMELQRLLPLKEVIKLVSVSRATIYRYLSAGMFPQPVRIGKRRVAWRASDLSEWFDKLQAA